MSVLLYYYIKSTMILNIKDFIDLTRLHFGPVWPLLFCSGAMLGFKAIGNFSIATLIHVAFIGFFGGTGGIVLNDYIDREHDKKDVETGLTRYWRPFGNRPIAQRRMKPSTALAVFLIFSLSAIILIFFLPFPQSAYVALSLCYCYSMEVFYQVKKRNQKFPLSQLLGRTDFSLFPAVGYIAVAGPAPLAFIYMAVFYPLAQVHLGVNDLADIRNDEARGMKSIAVLYGKRGVSVWIGLFSVLHITLIWLLLQHLQNWTNYAILLPLFLLSLVCIVVFLIPTPQCGLRMLPLIHGVMAFEASIFIVGSAQYLGGY